MTQWVVVQLGAPILRYILLPAGIKPSKTPDDASDSPVFDIIVKVIYHLNIKYKYLVFITDFHITFL